MEKPGLLREAFLREQQWQEQVPGWENMQLPYSPKKTTVSKMEESLLKLQEEKRSYDGYKERDSGRCEYVNHEVKS